MTSFTLTDDMSKYLITSHMLTHGLWNIAAYLYISWTWIYTHILFRHFNFTLRWRRNGRDGVSNHQPHDCLLNSLLRKHQSPTSLAYVRGIHRWAVNFPHKGLVTLKMFPFDDVIMRYILDSCRQKNVLAHNISPSVNTVFTLYILRFPHVNLHFLFVFDSVKYTLKHDI